MVQPMEGQVEAVKAKVVRAKEQLEAGLKALVTSEDWKASLKLMASLGPTRIGRFSFNNLVLLAAQGLNDAHVATFNAWRRMERTVRKGEKGLMVLRPIFRKEPTPIGQEESVLVGFSYLTVFGLSQTDGAPLDAVAPRDFTAPEAFPHTVASLRDVALRLPCVCEVALRGRQAGDPAGAYGWYRKDTRAIVVLTDTTPAQQFATLVHELAHALLHGEGSHHDVPTKEVEAESTSYVVCQALGLDTGAFTFPYVAHWATGEEATKAVSRAGDNIRRAATTILEALVPGATSEAPEEGHPGATSSGSLDPSPPRRAVGPHGETP